LLAGGKFSRPLTFTGKNNDVDTVAQTSFTKLNALRRVRSNTQQNGKINTMMQINGIASVNDVAKKAMARILEPKLAPLALASEPPGAVAAPLDAHVTTLARAVSCVLITARCARAFRAASATPRALRASRAIDPSDRPIGVACARAAPRGRTARARCAAGTTKDDVLSACMARAVSYLRATTGVRARATECRASERHTLADMGPDVARTATGDAADTTRWLDGTFACDIDATLDSRRLSRASALARVRRIGW
jgi:hypothetical protein